MHKLGILTNDGTDAAFHHQDLWEVEATTGPSRIVIAPSRNHVDLLLELSSSWKGLRTILYILLTSRCDNKLGRYESPAITQAQLSHFPVPWIVLTDEMALDFDNWARCVSTYWKLSQEQEIRLTALDEFLSEMSGPLHSDFWTDEALSSDPRWEEVRNLAKAALISCGWPIEVPPPDRLLPDGSVISAE